MNYSIQTTTDLNNSELLNTKRLQEAVAYTEKRLRKSHYRLEQIKKDQLTTFIRKRAKLFLLEINNLMELATELLTKLSDFHNIAVDDLSELESDLDLLNRMDYKLTNACSPFVDQYFEIPVIQMNRLAAA